MKTVRFLAALGSITALLAACLVLQTQAEIITDQTPVPPVGKFGGPARELTPDELEQYKRGRRIFDRDWKLAQGLGTPDLNGDSCRACHDDPTIGGGGGLDVNVLRFARDEGGAGPYTDLPGGQIASKLRRPDVPAGRRDPAP